METTNEVKRLYCWSDNEERFGFGGDIELTRSEAIGAAVNDLGIPDGVSLYIGVRCDFHAEDFMPDGNEILGLISERAYERAGEVADGWPTWGRSNNDTLTARLRKVVGDWFNEKNDQPSFYAVDDIEDVTLEAADAAGGE